MLLLFDIDGTLLSTQGAGTRAMREVAIDMFGDEFKWEGVSPGGNLDPLIFKQAVELNGIDPADELHDTFRNNYVAHLRNQIESSQIEVEVFPGIFDILETLRTRTDVTLGVLTGNYPASSRMKLRHANIDPDWFAITAYGDEAPTRAELVALAMDKYEALHNTPIEPHRVIVIGDTTRDIDCARANGCIAFIVETGWSPTKELRAANPDHLVVDLADPEPLLNLIK